MMSCGPPNCASSESDSRAPITSTGALFVRAAVRMSDLRAGKWIPFRCVIRFEGERPPTPRAMLSPFVVGPPRSARDEELQGPCRRLTCVVTVVGRLAPTPSGHLHLGNALAFGAAALSARGGRLVL